MYIATVCPLIPAIHVVSSLVRYYNCSVYTVAHEHILNYLQVNQDSSIMASSVSFAQSRIEQELSEKLFL